MPSNLKCLLCLLAVVAALPFSTGVRAQTYVPDDLQQWEQWVLKDKEYRDCPFFFNRPLDKPSAFLCAWPGEINLTVTASGARFSQGWTVYATEQWVHLPGGTNYWPDRVTVNDRLVEVVAHDNMPSIRLGPGVWRIAGRFEWDQRPGVLRIPQQTGLIALTVDGKRVLRPEMNRAGVFLGERQRDTRVTNSIRTVVHRLVTDNIPSQLTTRLQVDVSGSVREEIFGPILPDGFIPIAIDSPLPAKLEADGNLHLQVRPGRWTITLRARGAGVVDTIVRPVEGSNLAVEEIWSYRANDELRVTAVEGLPPVDPSQVEVPGEWQALPAFRVGPDAEFSVIERSRGIVSASNELRLNRTMWLDFSGDGFVVKDSIIGAMQTDWRLDMGGPYALLSATERGENLLITKGASDDQTGIEIRQSNVNVAAIGRADTREPLPVTGWDSRFAGVQATLNLPPGHKLLMAPGVDSAAGSWMSQWHLLDFFLVLIITISVWRLFGVVPGVLALAALVLSFHELGWRAWLLLNLLVVIALMRVAPKGRLRQLVASYQAVSAVSLALVLVVFVAGQLRIAIYPQLEEQAGYGIASVSGLTVSSDALDLQDPGLTGVDGDAVGLEFAARTPMQDEPMAIEEFVMTRSKINKSRFSRYAANAIVQAGPGIPSWQWNTYTLRWSGPVDADQSMRLVVLPRWLVSALRVVSVTLLLLFAAILASDILKRDLKLPSGLVLGGRRSANILAFVAVCGLVAASPNADAELPDTELLQELEWRLLEAPDCVPRCAEIVSAAVTVGSNTVNMTLSVHALQDVAIPLPGSSQGWRPELTVATGASRVFKAADSSLWVRVVPGRHTITLRGRVPAVDSLEIPFLTPPRVVTVESDGWFVAGIKDRRLTSGSLQLTRLQSADDADAEGAVRWESSRFPMFARVERLVELDLDWRVTTTVVRVAPIQGALTLEIPLLEGETIVSGDFTINEGRATVAMNPQQQSVSWTSNLPLQSPLVLRATEGSAWHEVWNFGVGNSWNAEFGGVPESNMRYQADGVRVAVFHPRNGESLSMSATRPTASEGATLAFDSVNLNVVNGSRSRDVSLILAYRSTRGSQHVIQIPEAAEVTSVLIDDREQTSRARDGQLTVAILPGRHVVAINWRESGAAGLLAHTPDVDIGAPASNIHMKVNKSNDRWLLATSGPKLGPAVLYWSELAALIVFALILGQTSLAPLTTRHWLLLGLGFSTFSWTVLVFVIVWLLLCGARNNLKSELSRWKFNGLQVVIAFMTVVALLSVVVSLPAGLLGTPDMHVAGHQSYGNVLSWFADRSTSALPTATVVTVPMWIYKVLILVWALWLSFALLRWLPWVWACFSKDGYWRARKAIEV